MLNVAHVKTDVNWRPIVTKFGTLIENMLQIQIQIQIQRYLFFRIQI